MDRSEIQLEFDPSTRQECLVGLNGELVPDSRILLAVVANHRLFSHVVKYLAVNQFTAKNPDYVHFDEEPLNREVLGIMRHLRDELVEGMSQCTETDEMVE